MSFYLLCDGDGNVICYVPLKSLRSYADGTLVYVSTNTGNVICYVPLKSLRSYADGTSIYTSSVTRLIYGLEPATRC